MGIVSTNVNNTNNHFQPKFIEHKFKQKDRDKWLWKYSPWLGTVQICGVVKQSWLDPNPLLIIESLWLTKQCTTTYPGNTNLFCISTSDMITGNIFGESVMTYSYAKLGQSDQHILILFCFNNTGKVHKMADWLDTKCTSFMLLFPPAYFSHIFKSGRKQETQEKSNKDQWMEMYALRSHIR